MKALAFLLALVLARYVSSASTHFSWMPGHQYHYGVRARLFTGQTDINTQYAGIQVEYKMILTVTGPRTLQLRAVSVKAVEVNAVLNGGWREAELENETPVVLSQEIRDVLESPMELQMRAGIVESIKVANHLPTWAVNMKKAQASYFVADSTALNEVISGNLKRNTPHETNQELGFFYETMEETVYGQCETYYTISQNGPFDLPFLLEQESINSESLNEEVLNGSGNVESRQDDQEEKTLRRARLYATYKKLVQRGFNSVDQIPEEVSQDESNLPWATEFHNFCSDGDQVFEIIKTVNFTACTVKPVLGYATSGIHGRPGDNSIGTGINRALLTRILACGKDQKQYKILKIEQEEQINAGLQLNQRTMAGTNQNITLLHIRPYHGDNLKNTKTVIGLSYTFDPQEQEYQRKGKILSAYTQDTTGQDEDEIAEAHENLSQSSDENQLESEISSIPSDSSGNFVKKPVWQNYRTAADKRGPLPKPDLLNPPLNPMVLSALSNSFIEKRVLDLMQEITDDLLTDKKSMAEAEALSKIVTMSEAIRHFTYQQIMELHRNLAEKSQTDEDQTSHNIYRDAVAIAGTNPAITALANLIKSGKIKGEEAAQVIMAFPMYIRTPTKELIHHIFKNLVDSSTSRLGLQVKTTAILSFSNLLYQAWVDTGVRNSRYPVSLYGEFGNQNDVEQKYALYFVKKLKEASAQDQSIGHNKHWTITYLKALGNLGVPQIIPAVQRILDHSNDAHIKTIAIFSLSRMILSRSSENIPLEKIVSVDRSGHDLLTDEVIESSVLPILVSVSFDKGEHPEVRMAAITLLLYTTPAHVSIWQQLAWSTWFESSQDVHSYVYSSLHSLAHLDSGSAYGALWTMSNQARAVLPLAKPTSVGVAKSHSIYHAGFVKHLQSASSHQFTYFGSEDSITPNLMHYRNHVQYANDGFGTSPIQISVYGQTIQKVLSNFIEEYTQSPRPQSSESEGYLQRIRQVLGVQRRDQNEDAQQTIEIRLHDQIQRVFSLNEGDVQNILRDAQQKFIPQLLASGIPVNYQKTMQTIEHAFEMPTGFGIPLTYNLQVPVYTAVRGTVKLVTSFKDIQLQAELHPVYAYKTQVSLSFKVPLTGKHYQAGLERQFVLEAPFRALARRGPCGKIELAVTPSQIGSGSPRGVIPIMSFHQKPYTVIITDPFWPVSHQEGGQLAIVHAAGVQSPFKRQTAFGNKEFGLAVELQEESEYLEQDEGQAAWFKFVQQFQSESCYFNLGWLGGRDVRYVERKLILDISKSETRTVIIALASKRQENSASTDLRQQPPSVSSVASGETPSSESEQNGSSESERQNYSQLRQNQNGGQQEVPLESIIIGSDEDSSQPGVTIAIAVIGKRTPIRSIEAQQSSIQKILHKGSPTTVQYFLQYSKTRGRVYIRAGAGDAANDAARALLPTSEALRGLRDAIVGSPNTKTQFDACVEFEGDYKAHQWAWELLALRKQLLSKELDVKIKAHLQFGKRCRNMPHEIKLEGKLWRGREMTEYAQSESREARKCSADEVKGFTVSPVCLWVAQHQAAALNKGDLKITFTTEMPKQFINRTDGVEDLAKALLYKYLSNDRFNEGAGDHRMRVEFDISPNNKFLDVQITKPNSKISFTGVPTNRAFRKILPLTATQSIQNNVMDRLLLADSNPSCSLQNNYLNTFDNVTYRFGLNVAKNCYHVLTKDCSGQKQMSVLAKDIADEQKKIVILLEGGTKIELTPPERGQRSEILGTPKLIVGINNRPVDSLPKIIRSKRSGEILARIESTHSGGVQVLAKSINLATDGAHVVLFVPNYLRNRTCGLCGDFNGEKTGEMKSPQNCPLSSGSALVASYAMDSRKLNLDENEGGPQCHVDSRLARQVKRENANCLLSAGYQQRLLRYPNVQDENVMTDHSECTDALVEGTRKIIFNLINLILKPGIWDLERRHRSANQVADIVSNQIGKFVKDGTALKISESIATEICNGIPRLPGSFLLRRICKPYEPISKRAILVALNRVCRETHCCTPSYHGFDREETESQVDYIMADSAESEEGQIPFVKPVTPAGGHNFTCLSLLEAQLPATVSKFVYLVFEIDAHLTDNARRSIAGRVALEVRDSIKKAVTRGESLIQNVAEAVQRIAPNQYDQILLPIVQDLTGNSLQTLQEAQKCVFRGL